MFGLRKVGRDRAWVVCECGSNSEVLFSEIVAIKDQVCFPLCKKCKCRLLNLLCVSDLDKIQNPASKLRFSAHHTLHKRLVDAGRLKEGIESVSYPGISEEEFVEV